MAFVFLFIPALAFGAIYVAFKLSCYTRAYRKIPTYSEFKSYAFEDDTRQQRSARAIRYVLISFAIPAIVSSPWWIDDVLTNRQDGEFFKFVLKSMTLIVLGLNYAFRSAIYYVTVENREPDPRSELLAICRKTGWSPRGFGSLGMAISISNVIIVGLFVLLILS